MNLLLARPDELSRGTLVVRGRRLVHLRQVLSSNPGDRIRVGVVGGRVGSGTVTAISADEATLEVVLDREPPSPLPVTVVLALPRPKMLRRILRACAETGVKEIHLINSYRVEKSFWQSPVLGDATLESCLLAGLEQAQDTILPRVHRHRRFRPFAEDLLPALCDGAQALLADPRAQTPYPADPAAPAVVIIGPEGGFIPFEASLLEAAGAHPVYLGDRILRVETALQSALGRHLLARG